MKNTYAKQSTAQHAKHAYPSFVFGLVGGWRVPFSHFLAIFLFRSLALDFMAAPSVVTPSAAVAVAVGVGSRVTLTNLQARHDLNEQLAVVVSALAPGGVGGGAGGVSSSDRGVFRLDSTGELVKARWINVKPYLPDDSSPSETPASVQDGRLVEHEGGLTFCFLLDAARYVTNVGGGLSLIPMQSPNDVNTLRSSGPDGLHKLAFLTSRAYSYWRSYPHARGSVHADIEELVDYNLDRLKDNAPSQIVEAKRDLADSSLCDVERWGDSRARIFGFFYVARKRDDGTLLVSADCENDDTAAVYLAVGQSTSLYDLICGSGMQSPDSVTRVKLTLLPYRHRLVFDGVVLAAEKNAPPDMASRVHSLADRAEQEGLVVSNLSVNRADLSRCVPDGATIVRTPENDEAAKATNDAEEAMGSAEASRFAAYDDPKFQNMRAMLHAAKKHEKEKDPNSLWVFRRGGYTEDDNPGHAIFIMAGGDGSMPAMPFQTELLEPNPKELFDKLCEAVLARKGKAPSMLAVDSLPCVAPLNAMLDNTGIRCMYYPPASEEETEYASRINL